MDWLSGSRPTSNPRRAIGNIHLFWSERYIIVEIFHVHSHDCQRLEQKRQRRLATCKTGVQERDSRNDEPDQERHDDQVEVVELESLVLSVDILNVGIAAVGLRLVKFRLHSYQYTSLQTYRRTVGLNHGARTGVTLTATGASILLSMLCPVETGTTSREKRMMAYRGFLSTHINVSEPHPLPSISRTTLMEGVIPG